MLRIEAPHGATGDFDLMRLSGQKEIARARWSLSLQFLFLEQSPRVQVVAIGRDHQAAAAETVLRGWANGAVKRNSVDSSVAQEIERIEQAIRTKDQDILRKYSGLNHTIHRHATLKKLPTVKSTNGGSIDGYASWWARRLIEADEGL